MSGSYLRRRDERSSVYDSDGRALMPIQRAQQPSYSSYPYYDAQTFRSGKEQIERALDLFFRRKWVILTTFLVAVAGAAVYTFTSEPRFEAPAYVSVDLGTRVVMDVTDAAGSVDNLFARNDRTLAGEIVLLQISDRLQQRVFARYADDQSGQAMATGMTGNNSVGIPLINGYPQFLPERGSDNIIQIRGTSADAVQAALIANLYAEEYVRLTEEASRSYFSALRKSLEGREKERLNELQLTEADIREYLRREGTVGLDQDGTQLVAQINQVEDERNRLRIDLQVQRASLAALEDQIADINPNLTQRITSERTASNLDQRIQNTQDQLALADEELAQILRVNPEMRTGDWDVLEPIKRRIRLLQAEVDSLTVLYVQEASLLGTTTGGQDGLSYLATLRQQATQQQIGIGGIETQIADLDKRLAEYQRELQLLPGQSMELAQYERSRLHAESRYQYVVERLQEARIAEESEPGYAQLIRNAYVPTSPEYPVPVRDLVLGAFLGLLLGFALAIIREKLDNRIYQPQQVREHGFREIAVIPNLKPLIEKDHDGRAFVEIEGQRLATSLVSLVNPISAASEAYRQVRTFAQFNLPESDLHTFLISSPGIMEGKSTTAANLAIVMAQAGRKTLLIDADMRRPKLHQLFGLHRKSGLRELLSGSVDAGEAEWKTFIDNLYVLTADSSNGREPVQNGKSTAELKNSSHILNPSELLGSHNMDHFLQEMRDNFDVIIFDSPPVLAATDAALLSTKCDATIVVARTGHTKEGELDYTMEAFSDVGATVLGVILNAFDLSMAFGHKYRYRHYTKYGRYSKYGYSDAEG